MSTCQSIQRALTTARVGVPREDGCFHKLHLRCLTLAVHPCLFYSWLCRTTDIVSQELRSLVQRISARCKEPNYFPVTRSYSSCSPTQRQFLNSYNRARSACISEMASNHPGATRADLRLFLEGWDKGEKWATQTYSPESCIAQSVANTQDQS